MVKDKKHKVIAYLRVSTIQQDVNSQKLSILNYANQKGIKVSKFIDVQVSSSKSYKERKIDELLNQLNQEDTLIVSELSRLGRSLSQIILLIDELIKKKVKFISIKEGIEIINSKNTQSKLMIGLFGLFAEIEKDLISERTKYGIQMARNKGKQIGRPKGKIGKSRLDTKEEEIKLLLSKKVSKSSIAKIMDISRNALCSFITSRGLI